MGAGFAVSDYWLCFSSEIMAVQKKRLKKLTKPNQQQQFLRGLLTGLLGLTVLAVVFIAGYFIGQWRLKKSQFCFPPSQLPRPLRRVMEETLGPNFLPRWQDRVVIGEVEGISQTKLVLATKDGQREIELTPQTRYFNGRRPARRVEIDPGETVSVLLDQTKRTAQAVIIVRSFQ